MKRGLVMVTRPPDKCLNSKFNDVSAITILKNVLFLQLMLTKVLASVWKRSNPLYLCHSTFQSRIMSSYSTIFFLHVFRKVKAAAKLKGLKKELKPKKIAQGFCIIEIIYFLCFYFSLIVIQIFLFYRCRKAVTSVRWRPFRCKCNVPISR